jgi:hypothetical protein
VPAGVIGGFAKAFWWCYSGPQKLLVRISAHISPAAIAAL